MGSSRSGFESFTAIYQLFGNVLAGHLSAPSPGFSSSRKGPINQGCSAQRESKLASPLTAETGAPQAPTGDSQATATPIIVFPASQGLKKCRLEKDPMPLHILFPLLAMAFQAGFCLLWVPPGLSLFLSVK